MKIIENKKLFGKINMLDIIIILILLFISILVLVFLGNKNIIVNEQYVKMKYDIEIKNLPKGTSEKIEVGDKIYDNEINSYIGQVVNVKAKDNIKIKQDYENNEFKEAINPELEDIYIEIECEVKESEIDFKTKDDYVIKVGKFVVIRGSNFAGSGYIMKIERNEVENENI